MALLLGGHLDSKMCGSHAIMTFRPVKMLLVRRFFARLANTSEEHSRLASKAPLSSRASETSEEMNHKTAGAEAGSETSRGKGASSKHPRQPGKAAPISEEELQRRPCVSPEDVLRLEKATEGESLVCECSVCC